MWLFLTVLYITVQSLIKLCVIIILNFIWQHPKHRASCGLDTCFSSHSGTSGQTSWLGEPNSSRDGRMNSFAPLGPGQPGGFGASPTGRHKSRRCSAANSHWALDTDAPRAFCQSHRRQQLTNYPTVKGILQWAHVHRSLLVHLCDFSFTHPRLCRRRSPALV